jgi:ribonuclease E
VGRISGFGLLEMSRQRLRPGMLEATTQSCPSCHGTGLIRSDDNLSLSILRQIEEEGVRKRSEEVLVKCPVSIANFIMNQKRDYVASIEKNYGLSVRIEGDLNLVSPEYSIEKLKSATRILTESEPALVTADGLMEISEEDVVDETKDEDEKPKKRRRRRRKKKLFSSEDEANPKQEDSVEQQVSLEVESNVPSSSNENNSNQNTIPPKKTNQRRRRKKEDNAGDANSSSTEEISSIDESQSNQISSESKSISKSEAKEKHVEKLPDDEKEKNKKLPKRQKQNLEIDKNDANDQENGEENSKQKRKGWWSLKS